MFWGNFTRICEENGTNPSSVCLQAGMGKNRPYNWKTGTLPKQEEMSKLAAVLNCTVADFFKGKDEPRDPQGRLLSDYELSLLEYFGQLDPMDQADVLIYTRDLCRKREEEARERYGA